MRKTWTKFLESQQWQKLLDDWAEGQWRLLIPLLSAR
jgi:hypothetical protein